MMRLLWDAGPIDPSERKWTPACGEAARVNVFASGASSDEEVQDFMSWIDLGVATTCPIVDDVNPACPFNAKTLGSVVV